jgi:hypothetical protein
VYSHFYEIPLPALRFEKVEETQKVKMTPKRTTPSDLTTSEEQRKRHCQYKDAESLANNDMQGTQMIPETMKRRQRKNVNKRFQETAPGTTMKPMTPARSKQTI